MFNKGDKVRITADWRALSGGEKGEVLGELFCSHVSCLVKFQSGTHVIPAVLLERARSAEHLVSAA
jgi:hypothetical protein